MTLSLSLLWLRLRYALKALLPNRLELQLRRALAQRKLRSVHDEWPILASAATLPPAWQGWPDNKSFALILTHDVDTRYGLDHCLELANIEENLGFRSCFNFVPHRRYQVPRELLTHLTARGFEVGVHGLSHDARTFMSRRRFTHSAPQINQILKDWNAIGFRTPSMVRNLDWIRELNIEYDMSTFDTDPFEPQPEGVNTIFPFWVAGLKPHPGYVELPYTLAQDYTLFVLLQMQTIDPWKTKLEWIASHGGMALLNTHPDYMHFDRAAKRPGYPVHLYQEFLTHLRARYPEQYWHVLPRDMSRFWTQAPERKQPRSRKRVCMMAYSFYDNDNRIIRYAEALSARGDMVDAISLRAEGKAPQGISGGVHIYRIQARKRDEKGPFSYLFRILRFWIKSSLLVGWLHLKKPYDLIHVHSVPDFEIFAAWLPKLLGAKLILDIHDLVPEFYASKFNVSHHAIAYKLLRWMERCSARFANHIIAANDIWHHTLTTRSVPPAKCTAFVNYLDQTLFYRHPRTRTDDTFRIVYPGGFQWHQGVDLAIRAFARTLPDLPNAEFHIYGDGPDRKGLELLIQQLDLAQVVHMKGPVSLAEIPGILANADLGIVPKRANSFGNEAYSTKILEYMSQGVPVIVSKTRIDTHYFKDDTVQFFESGNENDLSNAIITVAHNSPLRQQLIQNGFACVQRFDWAQKKQDYFQLVDSLLARKGCQQKFRLDRYITLTITKQRPSLLRSSNSRKLPVLMYHSITDEAETTSSAYYRTCTRPAIFAHHMALLHDEGYQAFDLSSGLNWFHTGLHGAKKQVVLTFDDGFLDFYTQAFPILQKYRFGATVFLPTAFIGQHPLHFKGRPCLTWSEARTLHLAGIEFGSHSHNHPQLHNLPLPQVQQELEISKRTIESELGVHVNAFSYPYSFPSARHQFVSTFSDLLKKTGYRYGVTTRIGCFRPADSPFTLKRLPINSDDDPALFKAKLEGEYDWMAFPQNTYKSFQTTLQRPQLNLL